MKHKFVLSKEKVQDAIEKTNTMADAANLLNLNFRTFKQIAEGHNLYKATPCSWKKRFELQDILDGKHPQYSTYKLSQRLVKEGLINYECKKCGICEYNNIHISLELNHIDGNRYNNSLDNLELLCPNCHSQTPTYRSKKLLLKNKIKEE